MKKEFIYEFLRSCPYCTNNPIEKFWIDNGILHRSGPHCPICKRSVDIVITKDPDWQKNIDQGVLHIINCEEKVFGRTVADTELLKKHAVYAQWLTLGKKSLHRTRKVV